MDKITIERETLLPCPFCGDDGDKGRQEVTQMIEGRNKFARITCRACGAMCPEENWNRRAALAAQPAEPAYTHADVAEAHAKGYALGLRQVDRPHPTDAQPTGQSPCARHCEAPAFEGEIRRLKREATIKDSLTIRPPAPAAVPLTDEQIDDICWNFNCSNTPLVEYDRLIARAIEAAHGIAAAGDKP
jgi:hypothetical protein